MSEKIYYTQCGIQVIGTDFVEVINEDGYDTKQTSPPSSSSQRQQEQQNYIETMSSSAEKSAHYDMMNSSLGDTFQDDSTDNGLVIEIDDDFLTNLEPTLNEQIVNDTTIQTYGHLMDVAHTTSAPSSTVESSMITSTAPMTPKPTPQFNDLFKKAQSGSAQAMEQLIELKIKEALDKLKPKDKNEANLKSKQNHELGHHSLEKNKSIHSSSESFLDGMFGPSTSAQKRSAKKCDDSGNVRKKAMPKRNASSSSSTFSSNTRENGASLQFGHDFSTKPIPKDAQKNASDQGVKKNNDRSLYLSSDAAKRCPLCDKQYKRFMVSHFRNVHTESEVFVSRLSPEMAHTLKRTKLSVTQYVRPYGTYLKMMCPFCETEKDFFTPYWTNHIRTHTGEYTNECIKCSKQSLYTSHCGQPTIKQECNLHEDGLSAYLCSRCNWVQIDEDRVILHVKLQHGCADAYQNEYQKITIIPPLNKVGGQSNPTNSVVHASVAQEQPIAAAADSTIMTSGSSYCNQTRGQCNSILMQDSSPIQQGSSNAFNDRPSTSATSTGIEILEDIVLRPSTLNSTADEIVTDFDETQMDTLRLNGLNIISEAPQLLNDQDDDIEMFGEVPKPLDKMIKVEAIDDEVLQKVFDSYNENDTNSFSVRPWMNAEYSTKKLCIDKILQFALYKCMYEKCIFATNSMANWQIHMAVHAQLIEYFRKQDRIEKDTRDRLIMYRKCPYCCFGAKADYQLLRHMEEDHRRSIFQCATCFYRAMEMDSMVLHMQRFHADVEKEILMCGETCEFLQQDDEVLQQHCELYVKKLQCGQGGCTEEYACYDSLYTHLTSVHSGTYLCPYCSEQKMGLDKQLIVEHLKNCGFPEFKCLKCHHDGFHDVKTIREHMADAHSSNYLFVGARHTKRPYDHTNEIQVIYIGNSQDTVPYTLVNCALTSLLDEMDPRELNVDRQLDQLKKLRLENSLFEMVFTGPVPCMKMNQESLFDFLQYSEYVKLTGKDEKPDILDTVKIVSYKCISSELMNEVPVMANLIDCEKDVDHIGCNAVEFTGSMSPMLRHRFKNHPSKSIAFIQTEKQIQCVIRKIVRCSLQCKFCPKSHTTRFPTCIKLNDHFSSAHPNHKIAFKIRITTEIIESNDPQQSIGYKDHYRWRKEN